MEQPVFVRCFDCNDPGDSDELYQDETPDGRPCWLCGDCANIRDRGPRD